MILVDASVWIDYFRGRPSPQTDRLDRLLGTEPLLVGDLILTEVLQGFADEADFKVARRLLGAFELVELGGRARCLEAAQHYRILRAKGVTVRKTIDTLIATYCLHHGHALLHSDRDFDAFTRHLGLRDAMALR